ncbi:hypothetical protein PR048_018051 [Dryococelus australis]|uniref:Uncharacterized protein n=1 Tax=Dryococelus australis TaxID=614101 RepID=A0ABQ9HB66_9NEOP|nr:hypothetical protein PR048_018051 [Dryococelus australis]
MANAVAYCGTCRAVRIGFDVDHNTPVVSGQGSEGHATKETAGGGGEPPLCGNPVRGASHLLAPTRRLAFHCCQTSSPLSFSSILHKYQAKLLIHYTRLCVGRKEVQCRERQWSEEIWAALHRGFESRGGRSEIPEKTCRPAVSSGTIPTYENSDVIPPVIASCSRWWEAGSLTTKPPRPPRSMLPHGVGGCTSGMNTLPCVQSTQNISTAIANQRLVTYFPGSSAANKGQGLFPEARAVNQRMDGSKVVAEGQRAGTITLLSGEKPHSPGTQARDTSLTRSSLHRQHQDGNIARRERRSDEALGVRVPVVFIAPSLLDLGRRYLAMTTPPHFLAEIFKLTGIGLLVSLTQQPIRHKAYPSLSLAQLIRERVPVKGPIYLRVQGQEERERYGPHLHARVVPHRSYAQDVQCFRRNAVPRWLSGGFSRGSPVSPTPSFRRCSALTSDTLIGSQHLAVLPCNELYMLYSRVQRHIGNVYSSTLKELAKFPGLHRPLETSVYTWSTAGAVAFSKGCLRKCEAILWTRGDVADDDSSGSYGPWRPQPPAWQRAPANHKRGGGGKGVHANCIAVREGRAQALD